MPTHSQHSGGWGKRITSITHTNEEENEKKGRQRWGEERRKEMRNISSMQGYLWLKTHLASPAALEARTSGTWGSWRVLTQGDHHVIYSTSSPPSQSHSESTPPLKRDCWDCREFSPVLRNTCFNGTLGFCCGLGHLLYLSLDPGMRTYLETTSEEELYYNEFIMVGFNPV